MSSEPLTGSELASRLSFFLWSSIPDEFLLDRAEQNQLRNPNALRGEVEYMLADPRADNLVTNFAAQWLYLRNLESFTPEARLFPDFDDNLRQAFRQETELLFREIMRENRSVLELLDSDHTYLNERLAKHYGIPHVYGSHFGVWTCQRAANAAGCYVKPAFCQLLRTHTGHRCSSRQLDLGKPAWESSSSAASGCANARREYGSGRTPHSRKTRRAPGQSGLCEWSSTNRSGGFSLENFDAIGRWRELEAGVEIDAEGSLPGQASFTGVDGLERAILKETEAFVRTLTEKLMTFALGRGIEPLDGPAIREIVRKAEQDNYRFRTIIQGIVESPAFSAQEFRVMFLTKKSLPRRTVLRGVGASLALPLLDAMIPSGTALAATVACDSNLRRLGYVYMPMGCDDTRWMLQGETLDKLSPTLQPLAPVRDEVCVISGLELRNAYPGTHATSNAAFLSAATAKRTESTDYYLGTTADQIAAQQLGHHTQLPSLEMAMDLLSIVGQCDNGYACVYQNNLSWSSPTTPLPAEAHPRLVFETLFGEGGTTKQRQEQLARRRSLLDSVAADLAQLNRQLGKGDRSKIQDYLDSVREVERRIEQAERQTKESPLPDLDRPEGVPADYGDHAKLMFDLQVLALQGDVTRVITFQLARETSNRTYPQIGVSEPHHPLTHHGNNPEKIAKVAKINQYHVSLFAYFLKRLRETQEAGGSLLDHSLYLYGSGMGNPNVHDHQNLPIIVAGGAAGKMRGGRHIQFDKPEPLANLHLTLLNKVGVNVDAFADSTGHIDGLFDV